MFKPGKEIYLTKGILEAVDDGLIYRIFDCIHRMKKHTEPDYLQVFNISIEENAMVIRHHQEVPAFTQEVKVQNFEKSFEGKIYVIDDGSYITVLLSEEY